jgi:hypothetical protein
VISISRVCPPRLPIVRRRYFHVVFRGDRDFELRFDLGVAAAERDLVEIEDRFEPIRLETDRLMGRGPHPAGPRVAQVDVVGRRRPEVGSSRRLVTATSRQVL